MCNFLKPCAKRMNATQKRSNSPYFAAPTGLIHRQYLIVYDLVSTLPIVFTGEECIPDQFLCLPGLNGSFKVHRVSSGTGELSQLSLLV